jgi:hypothetical protein
MIAGLVDECHLFLGPIVVGGVSGHCRAGSAPGSSCSVSAVSEAALFIFTTAWACDRPRDIISSG